MELTTKAGESFSVSVEDFERVSQKQWHLLNGYLASGSGKERVLLHNFILEKTPDGKMVVDHFDRNPLNNQRSNLRVISQSHNARRGVRTNRTAVYPGVYRTRSGTWVAQFPLSCRKVLSKTYKMVDDAITQRKEWELLYCSEELF